VTGGERCELDPEARPFDRQHAREVLDGGPRRRRVRHPGQAVMRRQRDVDDLAAAVLRDHRPRCDRVRHQPGAFDVQPHHGAEALRRDLLRGGQVLAARVVEQEVDAPVAGKRLVDERRNLILLADVASDRAAAPVLGARHRLLERLAAAPADHDLGAERGQLECRCAAEPRPSPAHQGHLPFE
jgi:hypothetical protein